MNIPHEVYSGELSEISFATILQALKRLIGRRGRLLWVDGD